jgi:hypothetical protein
MGDKMVFGLTLVLSILIATTGCVWTVSEFRGEEIAVSAEGTFGQIEVVDSISKTKGYLDFELGVDEESQFIRTGWMPVDRIIEITVISNEGIFKQYVEYLPLETNIYEVANVTITMISGYEPVGYFNLVERDWGGFLWIGLFIILMFGFFGLFDGTDKRYAYWERMRKDTKRRGADRKKREDKQRG